MSSDPFLFHSETFGFFFFFLNKQKCFLSLLYRTLLSDEKYFQIKPVTVEGQKGKIATLCFKIDLKPKEAGGEVFLKAFKQMSHYWKYFCPLKSLWKTLSWFHLWCHLISPTTQKNCKNVINSPGWAFFAFSQKEELLQCKCNDYCGSVHSQPASYKSTAKEKKNQCKPLFFASICLSHREN